MNKMEMQQEIENDFNRTMKRLQERQDLIFSTLAKYDSLSDSGFIIQKGQQLREIEMEANEARNIRSERIYTLENLN